MRDAGGQVTINLLTFPGISDDPAEIDALIGFIHRYGVHQLQLRSLNVDPHWLLARIPDPTRGIGMRSFVGELRARCPGLRLGNFTRSWPVSASEANVTGGGRDELKLIESPIGWASS